MNAPKPRLALDMDGPLADFDAAFFNMVTQRGWEIDVEGPHDLNCKRFMTDNMPHKIQRNAARIMIESSRWFRHLPVTPGAKDGVAELMDHFDVYVCTKPLERNATCRDDKYKWMIDHFPALAHRLLIMPNKSWCYADILLDDAPKMEDGHTWTPVIFPAGFNGEGSKWDGLPRWGWGDPIDDLLAHAEPPF